jgi:hypothetical protein
MGYRLKNFGAAPAMNTVVPLGPATGDVNNYSLIKAEVETACKTGENLVMLTGDLLLPGGEKPDTAQLGKKNIPEKFILPGCIVYRDSGGKFATPNSAMWLIPPTLKLLELAGFSPQTSGHVTTKHGSRVENQSSQTAQEQNVGGSPSKDKLRTETSMVETA